MSKPPELLGYSNRSGCPSALGDVESVDWAPAVNLGYQKTPKSESYLKQMDERSEPNQPADVPQSESISHQDDALPLATSLPVYEEVVEEPEPDEATCWEDFTTGDHSYCRSPLRTTTCDAGTQCSSEPLHRSLLRTDELSVLYTGLTLPAFRFLATNLLPSYGGGFQLDPIDQFLMTLMKLRLNLLLEDLAEKFGVRQSSVGVIVAHWIDVMDAHMRNCVPWLPKKTVAETMPPCFKEHYPGATCVINYSEISLQTPQSLDSRRESYSRFYYGQNAVRFMVATAPCGLIMFISPTYAEGCCDQFMAWDSRFLEYLRPGDEVVAGGGFKIRDLLNERRVKLTVPDFTKSHFQLSETSRNIDSLRIYVRRAIHRLKLFRILSETVPASLTPNVDKILRICAALCNLQGEILHGEVE
ncbi:uncharacterized protein PAE49_018568 isoform 2-T4 [Odontesthes bonariensis]|uniref:uncharacterized protein LOC142366052 isoform X2 n=1 Tax=Odontesthes bonariensis TaxID=219752 RepID=UPI003F58381D